MRSSQILVVALLLVIAVDCLAQPEPQVGKRWIVVPELTDEFEGTKLNAAKWTSDHNRHPVLIWPGRQPAVFHPDKVKVDSGRVLIEVGKLPEPIRVYKYGRYISYEYYGGCIRGFTPARIGQYYECEAKMNKTEMGGGFWMAAPHVCGKVREIDITESVGIITGRTESWARDWDYIMHSNAFYTKPDCSETTQTSNKINLPTKNHEQFYRYGFWWKSPEELLFYVNGEYAYSISLPDNSYRELYLQYDIEAYDWNPFPADGGRVANGSLEERTTQLNYIHTFKLVEADAPGDPTHELFNIYTEELVLDAETSQITTDSILSVPLIYKANEDREIHMILFNKQDEVVGEATMLASAGYSNMIYDFKLDSVPGAGTGYTLYADIRPLNSTIADTIMSDKINLELRDPSILTVQVMDEESNKPLPDVRISLNDSIKFSSVDGIVIFQNVSTSESTLELSREGYYTLKNEKLQILNDSLIVQQMSPERFNLTLSFLDYYSSSRIENASVTINDSTQLSGASGRVSFSLQKGRYKLLLEHPNYLYSDSIDLTQHRNEVLKLKKTFIDFYVIVSIDNKSYADLEVKMGELSELSDSKGKVVFPLLKIDSTYNYSIIRASEILKEDSVKVSESGVLNINISSLGSDSESTDIPMKLYPNPAKDNLYVPGSVNNEKFQVYNVNGIKVKSGHINQNTIDLADLPDGLYFLEIEKMELRTFIIGGS